MKNDHEQLEIYLDKFSDTVVIFFQIIFFIFSCFDIVSFTSKDLADFVVKYFMEKKKLNFLLKNNFLKRQDLSKCFDKYPFLSWIKDIKCDRNIQA